MRSIVTVAFLALLASPLCTAHVHRKLAERKDYLCPDKAIDNFKRIHNNQAFQDDVKSFCSEAAKGDDGCYSKCWCFFSDALHTAIDRANAKWDDCLDPGWNILVTPNRSPTIRAAHNSNKCRNILKTACK